MKKIVVSPATEKLLGRPFLDYLEAKPADRTPEQIVSFLDVDGGMSLLNQFRKATYDPLKLILMGANAPTYQAWMKDKNGFAVTTTVPGLTGDVHISMIKKINSLQEFAERWAHLPQGSLAGAPIPGKLADYYIRATLHEAAHLKYQKADGMNSSNMLNIPNVRNVMYEEYHPEREANRDYQTLFTKGIVSNREVPYLCRSMSAISDFTRDPKINAAKERLTVFAPVGAEFEPFDEDRPNHIGDRVVLDSGQDAYDSIRNAVDKVFVAIARSSGIRGDDPHVMAENGRRIGQENPALLYETARHMYQKGLFNKEPFEKAFVGRFIDAAERYAFTHFHVPENRIRHEPPVIPEREGIEPFFRLDSRGSPAVRP